MNVYVGKYSDVLQILNLGIGIATPTVMPNLNAIYTLANNITANEIGTYEINYFNNVFIRVGFIYSGSVIVTLVAEDVIDMVLSVLLAIGVTLESRVNATLTIKKLEYVMFRVFAFFNSLLFSSLIIREYQ